MFEKIINRIADQVATKLEEKEEKRLEPVINLGDDRIKVETIFDIELDERDNATLKKLASDKGFQILMDKLFFANGYACHTNKNVIDIAEKRGAMIALTQLKQKVIEARMEKQKTNPLTGKPIKESTE